MITSSCFLSSQVSFKIGCSRFPAKSLCRNQKSTKNEMLFDQLAVGKKRVNVLSGVSLKDQESSLDLILEEPFCSEGISSSQITSNAFTLRTVVVLPFYTFMVAAPQAKLTNKIVASSIPYIVLGLLYACLLYLSWTPDG